MNVLQHAHELLHDHPRLVLRPRPTRGHDPLGQVLARRPVHDDAHARRVLHHAVQLDHVWVVRVQLLQDRRLRRHQPPQLPRGLGRAVGEPHALDHALAVRQQANDAVGAVAQHRLFTARVAAAPRRRVRQQVPPLGLQGHVVVVVVLVHSLVRSLVRVRVTRQSTPSEGRHQRRR